MKTDCPLCGVAVALESSAAWTRCASCEGMVFSPSDGPEVLVVHGSEALSEQVGRVVAAAGMRPVRAQSGQQALTLVPVRRPRALVLDVALEGVMAFQILEWLRRSPEHAGIKVVLVASVFNKTAYKRTPSKLYGADDYVEQHHIPDRLPEKLCALLGLQAPRAPTELQRRAVVNLDRRLDLGGRDRVRALARQIVADIALYHQDDIALASRGQPAPGLPRALDEGRQLLADLVDPRTYAGEDPILDAFRFLISELSELVR
jgi:DNA-binding response OmpR family regulator